MAGRAHDSVRMTATAQTSATYTASRACVTGGCVDAPGERPPTTLAPRTSSNVCLVSPISILYLISYLSHIHLISISYSSNIHLISILYPSHIYLISTSYLSHIHIISISYPSHIYLISISYLSQASHYLCS